MAPKRTWKPDGSMTVEDGGTPKKKPGRKPVYIHKCSEKEQLSKMSLILVGNGHPEDGLAFRFREFMADHVRVVDSINEIKMSVNNIAAKYDATMESVRTTANALEKYKLSEDKYEEGKTAIIKLAEKNASTKRATATLIVAIIMALVAIFFGVINIIKTSNLSDNQMFIEWKMQMKADRPPTPETRAIHFDSVTDSLPDTTLMK